MHFTFVTSLALSLIISTTTTLVLAFYIPPAPSHAIAARAERVRAQPIRLSARAPPAVAPFLDSNGGVISNPDQPIVGFPGDIPLPAPASPLPAPAPVVEAPPAPEEKPVEVPAPPPAPVEPAPEPVVTAAPPPPPQGDGNVVYEYAYSTRFKTEIVYVTVA